MHKGCVCYILLSAKEWQLMAHKIHTKEKCLVSDVTYNDEEKVFSDSFLSSFGELLVVLMILIVILQKQYYSIIFILLVKLFNLLIDYC